MISVIIPLMRIEPYASQVDDCVESIMRQTWGTEILVMEQKVEPIINKPRLINRGLRESNGHYIWLCDADFLLDDETMLERMLYQLDEDVDVVYPVFRRKNGNIKICDGAPMARREVFEEFGPFNERDLGISYVTFPFLEWCLDNKRVHCSDKFVVRLNKKPAVEERIAKKDSETLKRLEPVMLRCKARLKTGGVWGGFH